ncbi:MAG TPA: 4-(cytidine 5'-diphospho)-2-C-methyl-D-erythritol kinase [Roseiarcus sp.]|nr:4-(cytidine 5'-diphospho)-2-C-methyl-D-erythritol kinase [Roseiarcus sp.]
MRWWRAPIKVNLTLRVIGRRPDGLHLMKSLVAFGEPCDWLGFEPGRALELEVEGPTAAHSGPAEKNLVLKAAEALSSELPNFKLGHFRLIKRLPAAAGVGGGSADAAAAFRALAYANELELNDHRVRSAALAVGADVPVCLFARACVVEGIGEEVGPPLSLPSVYAVLVNPGVAIATRDVFEVLKANPTSPLEPDYSAAAPARTNSPSMRALAEDRNDLETPAVKLAPIVTGLLDRLAQLPAARFSRMTGSGATCFAAFADCREAEHARIVMANEHPHWWVEATRLR